MPNIDEESKSTEPAAAPAAKKPRKQRTSFNTLKTKGTNWAAEDGENTEVTPRTRLLVSLNDESLEILKRLNRERGLGSPSTAIEFLLINFGPWVLSADFIAVLADTVRNNRMGGSENNTGE